MNDFQLKVLLTSLLAILFSLIFILLALVLPTNKKYAQIDDDLPQTEFEKMSKGIREGFEK